MPFLKKQKYLKNFSKISRLGLQLEEILRRVRTSPQGMKLSEPSESLKKSSPATTSNRAADRFVNSQNRSITRSV